MHAVSISERLDQLKAQVVRPTAKSETVTQPK